MRLDSDLNEALDEALGRMPTQQSDEFRRRFRKLCENAFVANQGDAEIRRVLELVTLEQEGD